MTTLSDLPRDLVEDIFSRVPLTSLRRVRSTCKTWNALSKTMILGQNAIKNHFMAFARVINYTVGLLSFELDGTRKENCDYDEDLADLSMKQLRIPHHRQVISEVYHCNGLLLCVPVDDSTLLVWNPYLGQTRWLRPRPRARPRTGSYYSTQDMYAIGYDDNNNRNHKIVRILMLSTYCSGTKYIIDVFDFRSASWRVIDVASILKVNLDGLFDHPKSISLKGNTYFCFQEIVKGKAKYSLFCFDFTTERFGPRLPLPQPSLLSGLSGNVTLSNVGDDKLALLYDNYELSNTIVIWITTKIDPNAVSWTKFLTLEWKHHMDDLWICNNGRGFVVIDEEKKVVVLFDIVPMSRRYRMAYIVGEDVYFRSLNMREGLYPLWDSSRIVSSCFVPSLVQPLVV